MMVRPFRRAAAWRFIVFGLLVAIGGWSPLHAAPATPPNDNFDLAEVIAGTAGSTFGSNVGATKELDEPDNVAGASVWYRWTAPAAATIRFSTAGSSFDTILGVYTGSAVDKLTQVAFNDDTGKDLTSEVSFTTSAGTVYHVLVDGVSGSMGDITLTWEAVGPPANDNFADAEALAGVSGSVAGSTVAATREPGEPAHAAEFGDASVWYRWVAPFDGPYSLHLAAGYDAVLAVYTGSSLTGLSSVGVAKGPFATVDIDALNGTAFHIAVDGTTPGVSGTFTLSWRSVVTNDNFDDAQSISGASGQVTGDNTGATREKDEPFHAGDHGIVSVWYRWQPDTSGETVFYTSGADFDTQLAVYTGATLATLVEVASNDDRGLTGHSEVRFTATAGVAYVLAVDGTHGQFADDVGAFTLVWGSPPANDDFADAQPLTGASGQVSGTTHGATAEPGESRPDAASIWYRFTPPFSGTFVFDTEGSDFDTVVGFFTGASIGSLTPLSSSSSRESAINAEPGSVYYVAVDGRRPCSATGSCGAPDVGNAVLSWRHVPPPANDNFANAQTLTGSTGSLVTSNLAATKESGEPSHGGFPGGASLWYAWVASASGNVTVDLSGSDNADLIGVYTGAAVDQLTAVPAPRTPGSRPKVRFAAVAGQGYFIAVDQVVGRAGRIVLTWSPTPANDDFAAAQVIAGSAGEISGTTVGATLESLEPRHDFKPVDATVWYQWQAPANGAYALSVDAAKPSEAQPAVYTGTALDTLITVGSTAGTSLSFTAIGGQVYRIAVAGKCAVVNDLGLVECTPLGTFTLSWSSVAAPANDSLANAQLLTGALGEVVADIGGATHEPGEPDHGDREGAASVWYRWSPPANQLVTFDTFSGGTVPAWTLLAVYTGSSYGSLAEVVRVNNRGDVDLNPANDPAGIRNNTVTFLALAGTTYHIAVDMKILEANSGLREPITLRWGPPPANDNFTNAVSLSGASGAENGDLTGATVEVQAGEPGGAFSGTVWYRWTAPSSNSLSVLAEGYHVSIFTGSSIASLTPVDTELNPSDTRALVFDTAASTTYYIRVADLLVFAPFCGGDCPFVGVIQGPFQVQWQTLPRNDFFGQPQVLAGAGSEVHTDNTNATSEPGEPGHGGPPANASLWYEWTAPASGTVTFHASGEGLGMVLAAYRGDVLSNLSGVASSKVSSDGPARIQFDADAGVVYRIAVDSLGGTGLIMLRWGPPPPNDDFGTAAVLTGTDGAVTATNLGATREDGEPDHAVTPGFASVWYRWTALHTALTRLDTSGSTFPVVTGVYTGTSLDTLQEVTSLFEPGEAFFEATAGTTYYVALDGLNPEFCSPCLPSEGTFTLAWEQLRVSVADVSVTESDSDGVVVRFPLTLSFSADRPVTVRAATADGTALAPGDYTARDALVTFAPGTTEQVVSINVQGETLKEQTETFRLVLSQPVGAYLGQSTGTATILDNDPNTAPVIQSFSAPQQAVRVGATMTVSVAFTDSDATDVHTVTLDWGDGSSSVASVTETGGMGSATATHGYAAPGLYTLRATISDGTDATSAEHRYVTVVDDTPGTALVLAGTFTSPAGAVPAQPAATGMGQVQAEAKYEKDGLKGKFRLTLQSLAIEVDGTAYEWLVVNGSSAYLKGQGVMTGAGSVGFLVSVVDRKPGGSPDRFRVKVWRFSDGAVVYDTAPGLPAAAPPVTELPTGAVTVRPSAGGLP